MSKRRVRILVVDDDVKIRRAVSGILREQDYDVVEASDGTEALERLRGNNISMILLDYQLPDFDGLKVLAEVQTTHVDLPVVMMSGFGTIKLAVEATKQGAYDFIEKPLNAERIVVAVRNSLEKYLLRQEVAELRRETLAQYEMVGSSVPMQRVYGMIDRTAPSTASVLILGESGTGKELVARAIHRGSPRAGGSFVKLNCAAIPHDLVESELFGHERGAFTGAVAGKPGKVELADKGTLFLDEIGDMSVHAQAKLLRFLQEEEFERVGGTETKKVDVRVLAASNKCLKDEVKAGRFREDLYFRLNVVTIVIPPLRERREDIPSLAEHFLRLLSRRDGLAQKTLSDGVAGLLAAQSWPGNVRELENAMHRVAVMVDDEVLTVENIRAFLTPDSYDGGSTEVPNDLRLARTEFEREHILKALARTDWNIAAAARLLGIERPSLHRKLTELGISRTETH